MKPQPDTLWSRMRVMVLLLIAAFAYGVVGYMVLEGWSFLDALYMTAITFTTIGYGEIRPLDTTGRIFTLTVMLLGVALALITVALVAQWIIEGAWSLRTRRKRMQRRIDDLSGHYLLCAYGRVGRAVAREFETAGVPFVVVDPKEELEERMIQDGVLYLIDDPSEEPVLLRAGVKRAKGLVCAVDSDATNVYITLMARSLAPGLFIVARASEPGSDRRLLAAGANRVVSPFVSSGRHMALVALRPRVDDVVEVVAPGTGSLRLEEVRIEARSPFEGRTLADAFGSTPVLAVRRADGRISVNPPGDLPLGAGDLVLTLGEEELSWVIQHR